MMTLLPKRLVALAVAIVGGAALAIGGHAIAPQNQDFSKVEIDIVPVRGNVYMLVGAGGNTTIQFGDEGVMVIDTQFAPMSDKILRAIKQVAGDRPIRYVVNTHMHGDHIGGNEPIAKAGRTRAGGNVRLLSVPADLPGEALDVALSRDFAWVATRNGVVRLRRFNDGTVP